MQEGRLGPLARKAGAPQNHGLQSGVHDQDLNDRWLSTFCHIRPRALFPVGKPFCSAIGSLWAQVPRGPQNLSSGILSRISPAGGRQGSERKRQEAAYFITHPPHPRTVQFSRQAPAEPWVEVGWGVGCWQHCPPKAPSLRHTEVNRGGGSLRQVDHGVLVHAGARCLLRVGVAAFRMRVEEQDHLLSW